MIQYEVNFQKNYFDIWQIIRRKRLFSNIQMMIVQNKILMKESYLRIMNQQIKLFKNLRLQIYSYLTVAFSYQSISNISKNERNILSELKNFIDKENNPLQISLNDIQDHRLIRVEESLIWKISDYFLFLVADREHQKRSFMNFDDSYFIHQYRERQVDFVMDFMNQIPSEIVEEKRINVKFILEKNQNQFRLSFKEIKIQIDRDSQNLRYKLSLTYLLFKQRIFKKCPKLHIIYFLGQLNAFQFKNFEVGNKLNQNIQIQQIEYRMLLLKNFNDFIKMDSIHKYMKLSGNKVLLRMRDNYINDRIFINEYFPELRRFEILSAFQQSPISFKPQQENQFNFFSSENEKILNNYLRLLNQIEFSNLSILNLKIKASTVK